MSDVTATGCLLVFIKAPVVGGVKTRLMPALGAEGAADFYKRLATQVVDDICAGAAGWEVWLCADAPAHPWVQTLAHARGLRVMPQGEGDLGARMARCLAHGLKQADAAMLVGSDCLGYDTAYLAEARAALSTYDAVLGPAEDGGYVLIGLNRRVASIPALFANVEWSTDGVFQQQAARMEAAGLNRYVLPVRQDIDSPDDLTALDERS